MSGEARESSVRARMASRLERFGFAIHCTAPARAHDIEAEQEILTHQMKYIFISSGDSTLYHALAVHFQHVFIPISVLSSLNWSL